MAKGLTKQEVVFAENYTLTRNGRQSAILAGYSESNASGAAHRLLKRSRVLNEIKRLEAVVLTTTSITREQLEAFYLKIMAADSTATIDQKMKASDLLCKLKGWHRRDIDILLAMDEHEVLERIGRVRTLEVQHQITQGNGE